MTMLVLLKAAAICLLVFLQQGCAAHFNTSLNERVSKNFSYSKHRTKEKQFNFSQGLVQRKRFKTWLFEGVIY